MRDSTLLLAIFFLCSPAKLSAAEDLLKALRKADVWSSLQDPRVGDLPLTGKLFFVLRHSPQLQQTPGEVLADTLYRQHISFYQRAGRRPALSLIWDRRQVYCKEWFHHGTHLKSYVLPTAAVTVSVQEEEKYFRVWIHVQSAEDHGPEIIVSPEQVRMLQVLPKFMWIERVPADSIARSIMRRASWQAAFLGMSGALATRTTTVYTQGNYSGHYSGFRGSGSVSGTYSGYSTVTVPDEEARARALLLGQQIQARSAALAERTIGSALKKTTVFPGKDASGFVYFKRDKKMAGAILQVLIGDVSFEFLFEK